MDGKQRSPGDRTQTVESSSSLRAQLNLLSKHQRREPGTECPVQPRRADLLDDPFLTGPPTIRDVPSLCRCRRHIFDLTIPERTAPWLAHIATRQQFSRLRGPARVRAAWLEGRLEAAAVFRVTDADRRWQLGMLTLRDECNERAVDAVLRCAVREAGEEGARRLFARMPSGEPFERSLRRSGFVPYMEEHVLWLRGQAEAFPGETKAVRRIHPADVWGVQQLYQEVVPRQVQYAEAKTSREWDGLRPLRPGTKRASGWVVEERGRIRAFARISTLEDMRVARLDLLLAPESRAHTRSLVLAAMSEARGMRGASCVAVVPAFEGEVVRILEEVGFVEEAAQSAFVCYTTVSARAQVIAVDLRKVAEAQADPAAVPGLGAANARASAGIDWFEGFGSGRAGQVDME